MSEEKEATIRVTDYGGFLAVAVDGGLDDYLIKSITDAWKAKNPRGSWVSINEKDQIDYIIRQREQGVRFFKPEAGGSSK